MKFKLNYNNYRVAVNDMFCKKISNPALYWNERDGFYSASDLVPNGDYCMGNASYDANSGGRSHTGTQSEYAPIARGIRKFCKTPPENRRVVYSHPENTHCAGVGIHNDNQCEELNHGDKCSVCGHQNKMIHTVQNFTIYDYIAEEEAKK